MPSNTSTHGDRQPIPFSQRGLAVLARALAGGLPRGVTTIREVLTDDMSGEERTKGPRALCMSGTGGEHFIIFDE